MQETSNAIQERLNEKPHPSSSSCYEGESLLFKSHKDIGMTGVYIDRTRNRKSENKWAVRMVIVDFSPLMLLLPEHS